jgi:putative peptidoglycan lipid II flippase
LLQLTAALAALGGFLFLAMGAEADWLKAGLQERLLHLAWLIPTAVGIYFASLWILGLRPAQFRRSATG